MLRLEPIARLSDFFLKDLRKSESKGLTVGRKVGYSQPRCFAVRRRTVQSVVYRKYSIKDAPLRESKKALC